MLRLSLTFWEGEETQTFSTAYGSLTYLSAIRKSLIAAKQSQVLLIKIMQMLPFVKHAPQQGLHRLAVARACYLGDGNERSVCFVHRGSGVRCIVILVLRVFKSMSQQKKQQLTARRGVKSSDRAY